MSSLDLKIEELGKSFDAIKAQEDDNYIENFVKTSIRTGEGMLIIKAVLQQKTELESKVISKLIAKYSINKI